MGAVGAFESIDEGRTEAFRRLYDREAPLVTRFARAALGDNAAAQDVCSEAFCRAWDAWPRFRGDTTAERAWIFRIARNQVIDHVRARRRARTVPLEDVHSGPTPEWDSRLALQAALRHLDKKDRELLSMRSAGLSHSEIGRVQRRSEKAVKQAWHRALKRLRAEMVGDQ